MNNEEMCNLIAKMWVQGGGDVVNWDFSHQYIRKRIEVMSDKKFESKRYGR